MKTFCICCPELGDRYDQAREHFLSRGVPVQFFRGIHGDTAGLITVHNCEIDSPGSGWNMGPAHTALCVSHYMLWVACSLLPDSHFLVLEDDADFPEGWEDRLNAALCSVPEDFDMLYVGSCCCSGRPRTPVAGDVYEVKYPFCTHAYVVAQKALPKLLARQRKVWAKIDTALIFGALPELRVYTVLPRIVGQRGTPLVE